MKKVAIIFILAVIVPSLVLAWLAIRSARDQQVVVGQQQRLLYQGVADTLAKDIRDYMVERQREFAQTVEKLRQEENSAQLAHRFDDLLREHWTFADVGFAVTTEGSVLSPSLFGRAEARQFRLNNDRFLCAGEPVQVYWNSPKYVTASKPFARSPTNANATATGVSPVQKKPMDQTGTNNAAGERKQEEGIQPGDEAGPDQAEFRELVGKSFEGTVARFLQNRLKILLWYRSVSEPALIYGAQLNLTNITSELRSLVRAPDTVAADAAIALLNDGGMIVAGAEAPFHPFVVSEIGYVLPHWKIAISLRDPENLSRTASTLKLMLLLLVVVMVSSIALGSFLVARDLKRQLILARQKTDFVSNVSHELKTPLTSIRMFSELLAQGKIANETEQRRFLQIIGSETARLTRLINNVLDFARMERGENNCRRVACDLKRIVQTTVDSYRPQLDANGFAISVALPDEEVEVRGDCDALAQVIFNLLSNAEKYSSGAKEITVQLRCGPEAAELRVLDRGGGVPSGSEERIFEQFYRAHDSLSSGIQGSGLGLTLARQIARAHDGDVHYEARPDGGSCFILVLPLAGHGPVTA